MEMVINLLGTFLTIYILCMLAWVLLSWLPMLSPQLAFNSTVVSLRKFLDSVIEPWVRLFRFVPPLNLGGAQLDLSVLVAIIVLQVGGGLLLSVLAQAAGV